MHDITQLDLYVNTRDGAIFSRGEPVDFLRSKAIRAFFIYLARNNGHPCLEDDVAKFIGIELASLQPIKTQIRHLADKKKIILHESKGPDWTWTYVVEGRPVLTLYHHPGLEIGINVLTLIIPKDENIWLDIRDSPSEDIPPSEVTSPLPTLRSNVEDQPVTPLVYGREEDLSQITKVFFPEEQLAEGRTVAVSGLGGMGKTTLALEYARRYGDRYRYRFFCVASSSANLTTSYRQIAGLLKEEDPQIKRCIEADPRTKEYLPLLIQSVQQWLQRTPGYLLILDNADLITPEARTRLANGELDINSAEWAEGRSLMTEDDLKQFLPNAAYRKGHLLITSRNAVPAEVFGQVSPVELDQLSPEAAQTFLLERTHKSSPLPVLEQEALLELIRHLHGLPLALEHVGAYVGHNKQSFSTYLAIYRNAAIADPLRQEEEGLEVLARGKLGYGKYEHTIETTWLISFGAVEAESKAAATAFTLSAFMDGKKCLMHLLLKVAGVVDEAGKPKLPILHEFFVGTETTAEQDDRMDQLLEPLTRYSLIKKHPFPQRTFEVHSLVQAVRRRTLTEQQRAFYIGVPSKAMVNRIRR